LQQREPAFVLNAFSLNRPAGRTRGEPAFEGLGEGGKFLTERVMFQSGCGEITLEWALGRIALQSMLSRLV
jgi:hypothetical protein